MAKEADSYVIRDYLKSNPISESNTYAKVALKFNTHKERIRSIWRRLESYNVKNVSEKTSHEVKDYKKTKDKIIHENIENFIYSKMSKTKEII